ncbi:MAG: SDR family NAD(P)-dependent oxidoreductase [Alphaproteobacteria bacterium]|nr:SDR family NAD(P)-dependent oxidoreductase [Alphaproteobacteria bacterium]
MVHTALVTGGNRGIGLEICRQLACEGHAIVLGSRDPVSGEEAATGLRGAGHDVRVVTLDVSDDESVRACADELAGAGIEIDVLVNNAGVIAEGNLLSGNSAPMKEAIAVNFLGPYRTARAFMPGMARRGWGRVINVSSGWGSFASGLEGPAAYAISKAALNALTVRLAREAGPGVLVNCMCPGWVRTRMGGATATRSVAQGADTALFLATLPDDGPTGGFFRDRTPEPW